MNIKLSKSRGVLLIIPCLTLAVLFYDWLISDILSIEDEYLVLTTCLIGISIFRTAYHIPIKASYAVFLGIITITIYNYWPLYFYVWGHAFAEGRIPIVLQLAIIINAALMIQSAIQLVRIIRSSK